MMTLEEVWESLRQDPEIKATMEEAEKSYKLFKKIENLIIADLEAKLKESEKLGKRMYEQKEYAEKILRMSTHEETKEICKLKQQLAETDKLMQEYLSKCLSLEQQLAEKEKEVTKQMEDFEKRCQEYYKGDEIKYDFAIETLEKLRHDIWTNQSDDGYTDMQVDLYDLNDMIDVAKMMLLDEIEELKGEK